MIKFLKLMKVLTGSLLLIYSGLIIAHSGGLDSDGGHYNRKTNEYHCHQEPCFSNKQKIIAMESLSPAEILSLIENNQDNSADSPTEID